MSDYIRLTGTEAVERAGRNMAGAAEDFGRHVSYLDEHLSRFLARFEELVERMEAVASPAPEAATEDGKP